MEYHYNIIPARYQVFEARREAAEVMLDQLGWYTGTDVEMPIHVSNYDASEEEKYQSLEKPKVKHEDWRSLKKSLKEKIAYLCCNELFSDFFISLKQQQGKCYPAHRFILALQSDFFQRLFYGAFQSDKKHHQVEVSSSMIEKILSYVYGRSPSLNYGENGLSTRDYTELSEMMYFADMYLMPSLSSICEENALRILNTENRYLYACHLFQTAYILNLDNLKEECLELYQRDFEQFLSSPFFVTLKKATVKTLYDFAIKVNKLNGFREIHFTPFLTKWCRSELERSGNPGDKLYDLMAEFLYLHL